MDVGRGITDLGQTAGGEEGRSHTNTQKGSEKPLSKLLLKDPPLLKKEASKDCLR